MAQLSLSNVNAEIDHNILVNEEYVLYCEFPKIYYLNLSIRYLKLRK